MRYIDKENGVLGEKLMVGGRAPQCYRYIHHVEGRSCKAYPNNDIPKRFTMYEIRHLSVETEQFGEYTYESKPRFTVKRSGFRNV